MKTKTIRELFYDHNGNLIHKWDHYFDIYEKYFSKYQGKEINMLEIGISHGGSLQLWKKYFGDKVHIHAIDINPECKKFEEENVTVYIGSQNEEVFLSDLARTLPEMDIIIDDGGHTMSQQLVSFEYLYLKVKEGGVYIVEDTHTSYWTEFHGGLRNPESFIERSKRLIDSLYDNHIHDDNDKKKVAVNEITSHINGISFYDSMVVFEKEKRKKPFHIQVGNETITPYIPTELKKETLLSRMKSVFKEKKKHSFDLNNHGKI
ncbi:class I SAM-dependent methyltransferase [Dyadobacter sp. NIV53]|uniref:class I SAM-dependent methyltransferase n=1 Tax=Dyadobacter sp. NIV53 TaxID=2861765 RepID=UPI001C873CA4|nr:class I SAM-dependent methyltransferase [Dyadobacter sp. NIV53]